MPKVDLVFDGSPGPATGNLVEVENDRGKSFSLGEWIKRPDGYWVLRFELPPQSMFSDVGDFYRKFGLPTYPETKPNWLAPDEYVFRINHIKEELEELEDEYRAESMEGVADAIADLAWLTIGLAHAMGIPLDDVWAEVRRANMEKERSIGADDPRGKRGHKSDIVKPEGWRPPSHAAAIRRARDGG